MATPFEDMTEIDRLVHDPSRLAITSALSACESAGFLFLQQVTGLSKGNLSSHPAKLEKGGIVKIYKTAERAQLGDADAVESALVRQRVAAWRMAARVRRIDRRSLDHWPHGTDRFDQLLESQTVPSGSISWSGVNMITGCRRNRRGGAAPRRAADRRVLASGTVRGR